MSTPGDPPAASSPRSLRLLTLGALLGLVATAVGLMRGGGAAGALPEGSVALVNGEVLRVEQYERALAALASDRREALGAAERRHVLDRLIEEELLVQRGLALGLARHDRQVRGDIVSAVIQSVVAQSEGYEPSEDELEDFYTAHAEYFARTPRLVVRQLIVRGPPRREATLARARIEEAHARLVAGEPFDDVMRDLGDEAIAPLPADPLPLQKLREYVGPTASAAAQDLPEGGVSEPLRSGSGWQLVQVVGRDAGFVPPLSSVRDEVRAELVRRAGDEALRAYLAELRDRAEVVVSPEVDP